MKVTVLVDNRDGEGLKGEWGLSFYIEYENETGDGSRPPVSRILLDAGLSGLFARNAAKLGIDLESVDCAVLSHAHDDHANGLDVFLEINDRAKLYVAGACDENCYDLVEGRMIYAGIPKGLLKRHAGRTVKAAPDMRIGEGIRLLGHTTPGLEELGESEGMYLRTAAGYIPDDFRHEQSLVFERPGGVVIFNSCSHAGADNIINEVMQVYPDKRILAMIGGFHLFNKSDEYIRAFACRLKETGAEGIYTGHCTRERAMEILAEELGDKLHAFRTGLVFEL